MRIDHAREIRERLTDPAALCTALGLRLGRQRQARGVYARCPAHSPDNTPSCSVRVARDGTVACRCMVCGWTGDALGLLAEVRGLNLRRDFPLVLEEAAALAGYSLPSGPPPPRKKVDPAVLLAMRIDEVAENWLAGRSIKPDPMFDAGLSPADLGEALADLAAADAARSEQDAPVNAELDRLAIEWQARERERDAAYRAEWEALCRS